MGDIASALSENRRWAAERFARCGDILQRQVFLDDGRREGLLVYVEAAVSNLMLEEHVIGLSDVQPLSSYKEAQEALLAGNGILFLEGDERAYKISSKGYPGIGVSKAESEKVMRGSREGFTESEKINVALIRKRLRDPRMKVEEQTVGSRSHTMTALIYMEDLIYPRLLDTIRERMDSYEIDGIMDSGMLEQLTEKHWLSPFPQFQSTERPDRAAAAVLEGRIVLAVDHSPTVLIFPSDYNSFFQTCDDWYNRFEIASFARFLRFFAAILAMSFPAIYVAVTTWHTSLLPTNLVLSMAEARRGVPFPSVGEVLLMEISFELIREAGIRLPGPIGNTIGIVGGLIIGQSAVAANVVSPIVVIVVAFTALCSFAIPNEEFASAFRLLKYGCIFMGAWLGLYGVLLSYLWVLIHLSHLNSFGIPYLMPYVASDLNGYEDEKDSLLRFPMRMLTRRPVFARRDARIKLRRKD
ncbi:MAG: spore germination protein [Eubacteriales bacterium]|nr:spore germination protein [Eubacteriales bacterium]